MTRVSKYFDETDLLDGLVDPGRATRSASVRASPMCLTFIGRPFSTGRLLLQEDSYCGKAQSNISYMLTRSEGAVKLAALALPMR